MLVSYIIGLISGILLSLLVFYVYRSREIKYKLKRLENNKKYIKSVTISFKEFVELINNYFEEESPSKLMTREVKKVVNKESKKWGARANDTNTFWTNIRNNISSSNDHTTGKESSDV